MNGADDGIRTRDLRFTKPLLYQLSYVGAKRAKDCIGGGMRQEEGTASVVPTTEFKTRGLAQALYITSAAQMSGRFRGVRCGQVSCATPFQNARSAREMVRN
jgi:hypothetical protein